MNESVAKKIADFVIQGDNANDYPSWRNWRDRVTAYLQYLFGEEIAKQFAELASSQNNAKGGIGFLEALTDKIQGFGPITDGSSKSQRSGNALKDITNMAPDISSGKVFIGGCPNLS